MLVYFCISQEFGNNFTRWSAGLVCFKEFTYVVLRFLVLLLLFFIVTLFGHGDGDGGRVTMVLESLQCVDFGKSTCSN